MLEDMSKIKKSAFHKAEVTAPDLRGGAACFLSALAAEGVSKISNAQIIRRGYERLCEKLGTLGAEVKYKKGS